MSGGPGSMDVPIFGDGIRDTANRGIPDVGLVFRNVGETIDDIGRGFDFDVCHPDDHFPGRAGKGPRANRAGASLNNPCLGSWGFVCARHRE